MIWIFRLRVCTSQSWQELKRYGGNMLTWDGGSERRDSFIAALPLSAPLGKGFAGMESEGNITAFPGWTAVTNHALREKRLAGDHYSLKNRYSWKALQIWNTDTLKFLFKSFPLSSIAFENTMYMLPITSESSFNAFLIEYCHFHWDGKIRNLWTLHATISSTNLKTFSLQMV